MKPLISNLIEQYSSVSIIGMCKNAGKTTVLNRMIRELSGSGRVLGLTSIGRDGESKDLVTGTGKPEIHVWEGTLVATAAELVLSRCDVTREILGATGISTPMGDVVLLRARSDGFIQLAGPSMTGQLADLREEFFRLGADMVIVDGALGRKTLCSRKVTEATVLCTGASYHKDIGTVVEETAYVCSILTLPETAAPGLRPAVEEMKDPRGTLLARGGAWAEPEGVLLRDALKDGTVETVFLGGALSDALLQPLLMSGAKLDGVTFVVRDSSKILLKRENYEKLLRRGTSLEVLDGIRLAAVAVNPFSAYGYHFSKEELMARMQDRVDLPVINVMEDAT